jgi:sialate O-acetylesterase
MNLRILFFVTILFQLVITAQIELQLPALISDNMVLQQKSNVKLWGKANPAFKIEINTSWGKNVRTTVKQDSTWEVFIETPSAGGPFEIVFVNGESKRKIRNVLTGEVWICSGQSNMEMPLKGYIPKDTVLNSDEEIRNADCREIRLFTVKTIASLDPQNDCYGNWDVCTSSSAANFSAVGYFFAKKLYDELKIPFGIIHSSWGGTPIESWTDKKYLSSFGEFDEVLEKIDKNIPAKEELRTWLQKFPSFQVSDYNRNDLWNTVELFDSSFCKYDYDDSQWETMNLPVNWEKTELNQFNGFVWFRKQIQLPDNWIGQELTLELGAIDDYDVTYVNGKKIGATKELRKWKVNRVYKILPEININKIISLAVRVNDTGGIGGGIYGGGFDMKIMNKVLNEEIPLNSKWKFMPVAELFEMKYYLFSNNLENVKLRPNLEFFYDQRTPTVLYNGMISPLTNYLIKGVIWYQGESNTHDPFLYEKLFPALIQNWRESWGYNFPFYYVQIAPYKHGGKFGSEFLRDAQRKSLYVKNTGMTVTLDLGDSTTVHPPNKKPVGERLALWALAKQHNKQVVFSGPIYKEYGITEDTIKILFDHIGSGLVLRESSKSNQFEIAGADKIFKPADVKVKGHYLLVWSDEIKNPKAVRYAWKNIVTPVLFNKENLPASSFRTDNW